MSVPTHLKYTAEHEWLDLNGDVATVGITSIAADALGDVVYLQLPAVGSTLTGGEPCGEVESTKSVSDLYAPADGEVVEVNGSAVADPGLLNRAPFEEGWLFRMKVTGMPELLDATGYDAFAAGD